MELLAESNQPLPVLELEELITFVNALIIIIIVSEMLTKFLLQLERENTPGTTDVLDDQEPQEVHEPQEVQEQQELRELREVLEQQEPRELQEVQNPAEARELFNEEENVLLEQVRLF